MNCQNTFCYVLIKNLYITLISAVVTGVEEMVPNHRAQNSELFTKISGKNVNNEHQEFAYAAKNINLHSAKTHCYKRPWLIDEDFVQGILFHSTLNVHGTSFPSDSLQNMDFCGVSSGCSLLVSGTLLVSSTLKRWRSFQETR